MDRRPGNVGAVYLLPVHDLLPSLTPCAASGYTQSRRNKSEFTQPSAVSRQSAEDRALSTRTQFHGSGALSFSTKGEYGVRLMVQLGRHYGTGPASLADIAAEEALPRPYLEQLVMGLRDAGLVTSTRGARGGYELARPPAEIRMSEVIRALEGPIAPMICATDELDTGHGPACDRTAYCSVNLLWVRIRDAISGTLQGMTLADLVPHRIAPGDIDPVFADPQPVAPSFVAPVTALVSQSASPFAVAPEPVVV